MTTSPSLIDDAPERTEEFPDAVNLVQDDQVIFVLSEKESGLRKSVSILPSLKV